MRRLAPALVLAVAACGGDDGPTPPTGPARVTVLRYAYEIDLDTRATSTTLSLHVTEGGDCITLANRNPTLTADAVTLDGQPARVTLTPETVTACGAGWFPGTDVTLAAHLSQPLDTLGPSQVGFSITPDADQQPVHYLVSWVEGCDQFGPCDPTPSTFAHYRFTVHHADGVKALCPGRVTAAPTVTTCEFDLAGGPTYSTFGLIANASWRETSLGTWDGVRVSLWARPGSRLPARIVADYHRGFLAWMKERFGPYPYGDELRIVVAPTYWAGFEHPGNIVLDESLAPVMGTTYPVAHTLVHELAHQWAGDQTTLADTYDFVWKESMAEYLSFLYESEVDPAAAARTLASWKSGSRGARYHPVPEDRPALFDYYGDVYGPGPMVLFRQLEVMTSRAQVVDALKMLLGQERAISVDDVQAALEATTGLDLDRYFDIWVRGSGAPTWGRFMVQVTREPPVQHVMLTEVTDGSFHPCDFNVEVRGAEPGQAQKIRFARGLDPDGFDSVDTDVPFVITSTVIDPDVECLAFPAAAAASPLHPPGWSPWVIED
jgi:aminopeptidase N